MSCKCAGSAVDKLPRVQKVEVLDNLYGGDHDTVDFLLEVGRQVALIS